MSTNINSTEQIVEINAGDQITNVNIVSQSTTQVISGEQVVTIDTNAGTIPAAWGSITGTLSNQTDLQNALNLKQNNITLTTTGTTGVASLVGSTLNIPNYVSSTKQSQWDSAYNDKINSAEVSGTTTKTLTLTQQDGGIIQASWSDFDTAPVTSVFGRTGDVVSAEGDYNINQLGDVTITSATNGQVLKYNGTAWVNAADASGLTSVGLAMPSAFTVSGSPLTSNGTITVTGAGTTSQYVRGDGSLATFPTTSNEAKTLIREVYNSTGATLTKGTVVYINGGQGNLPTITKAIASGDPTSAQTFGIVQSDITNMNNGFVVVAGGIDNLDTQAYTVGTALYLSPTTAGAFTSTKPYAPNHLVYLGVVVRSHPTQGVIEVKIQNGYELDELHNVSARFPTNKDGLFYNSTSNVWENKSIAGVLGYTPVPQSRIITINGTAQDLSADRTYNVGTVTSVSASGGTGISISGSPVTGSGTISITNTAPDQIVSLTGVGTTSISGTYPNFTVTSNDQYVGTVTSVNATVPTGFEVSGVPITSSGTVDIKFASGYSLPTNAKQTQWDDAYAKRIDSLTVTGNSGSATLTSNVLNVPTYTLTGLGGEPAITAGTTSQYWRGDKSFQTLDTSVVPENGNVYFTEPRVRATVLSGLNITGGSISASDSVLNAFGKVQNQINGLIGGSIFQSTWNASTNTPSLASGVGTKGYYYIVSVAGTTNLDGITDWQIGDWAIFDGTVWRKVDNTDAVVSVNGFTGTVSLGISNLADVSASSPTDTQLLRFNGTTSKWYNWTPTFEPALTKGNLTEATSSVLTITGGSNAVIGSGTSIQVKQASSTGSGYLSSTDWNTFNNKQATISLTTTGSSGASTFVSNVLNVPNYTLSGLGGVPTSRTLTINGTGYDLSADRTWSVGTVTSIGLSTGTTGTDVSVSGSPVTGSGTITLNIPIASATNTGKLSSTDWSTFNAKEPAVTKGNLTESTSSVLTITGGTGAVIGSGTTIEVKSASATQNGVITTGTQTIAGAKTLTGALSGTSADFSGNVIAASSSGYFNVGTTTNSGFKTYIKAAASGLLLSAGTTSTDNALLVQNQAETTTLFNIKGNGATTFSGGSGYKQFAISYPSTFATKTVIGDNNFYIQTDASPETFTFYNTTGTGDFIFKSGASATTKLTLSGTGAATFSSSVTAGGFIDINGGSLSATNGLHLWFNTSTNTAHISAFHSGVDWRSMNFNALDYVFRTYDSAKMTITSGGNVGIGTTSPSTALHVIGAGTFSSSVTAVGLSSTTSANGNLNTYIRNTVTAASGVTGYGLAIESEASAATSYALTVRNLAGSNTYFHISTETGKVGNVGIGTTSPTNPLHIQSNTISQLNVTALSGNTNAQINLEPTGTGIALIGPANNVDFALRTNATERMRITSGGVTEFKGTDGSIISRMQSSSGMLQFYPYFAAYSGPIIQALNGAGSATVPLRIESSAATFTGTVTATSFFESSDMRLKSNIQDYKSNDILNISAKIYEKDGKTEVGYLAQDLENVLSSAISVRNNGYLDLSYRQVHTAKIAALEAKIKELEAKLK